MALPGVNVSVEAVIENQIQEVTLDGQEIYVPTLSMSENLTKLANKIDFYKDESEEKGKPTSEGETEAESDKVVFQPSLWPWDSVRSKLKTALTETNVLLDVLNIAKEKRYMVLDPVPQEPPDSRPAVHLLAKKNALTVAADILKKGAERLRKSQSEMSRSQLDFHFELLKLRQLWRLRKVGKTILGDLSYKSAGSRFWQGGTFEVTKSSQDASDPSDPHVAQQSSLEVIIPSELEGVSYIQVEIRQVTDSKELSSASFKMPSGLCSAVATDAHWQQKLEVAQNVLFCKELFSQLARESVHLKSAIPHVVIGKQIITTIFPGVQLSIVLCHFTGKEKRGSITPHGGDLKHNHVLEHSLHQLLREFHYKSINHPTPHPVTATFGMSKRRRLAGPQGFSRRELLEMTESECLLEQIIKQTQHVVLRLRARKVIDNIAVTVSDPLMSSHWSSLNSSLESSVSLHMPAHGYESARHKMVIQIGTDSIKCICRDGTIFSLGFEERELHDLLLWQISQHHINALSALSKMMSWQVLSSSMGCGVGNKGSLGTVSTIMMASMKSDRVVSVRSCPTSGLQVFYQTVPKNQESNCNSTILTDPKWQYIAGPFQEVNLDMLEGKNFANKMELLMSSLSTS